MLKPTLLAALATFAAGVAAKDAVITTSMFLVGFDKQSLVASVVASDATATTFSVACAEPTAKDCQIPTSFTFTQGPSTMHFAYSHKPTAPSDPERSVDVGCTITADHGECSKSLGATLGSITSTAASATTTFTSGGADLGGQTVTITGGSLAVSTTASSTTSTKSSSTSKSSSSTSSASITSSTVSPQSSSTEESSTSTTTTDAEFFEATKSVSVPTSSSSKAAMAMITSAPQWVIGGAAAVVAFAAL